MNYWTEGDWDSKLGVTCNFDPTCPFHPKTRMLVNDCKLLTFSLRMDSNWDSHALDVVFMCPICGYHDIFGVAISDEHHRRVVKMVNQDREKGIGKHEIVQIEETDECDCSFEKNSWVEAYQ